MQQGTKAIVLLSGGLDSTTALALAQSRGFDCHALSVRYGQRHGTELDAAIRVAREFKVVEHRIQEVDLSTFKGSALTDDTVQVPDHPTEGIPVTYVPARNTIFLSIALAWAEVLHARDIFIGVNAVDYSGYPDCRPEYIQAFQRMANLATRDAVEGHAMTIHAPLVSMTKSEIIQLGDELGVDYSLTVSCYSANGQGRACGVCDACRFRRQGFVEAGIEDPTPYA
ncbi:MAG: 7-cyano-7-deazaguanine synthase QueC [Gammaproteobacteria bacterium]|nr:7-cyano-7-deazaguanine synthase QueC [Gammaproteobacteria bacterium]